MMDQPTTISGEEWNTTDSVWGEEDLPRWVVGMDNAATLIMTGNTVTLMLGMGAATYWKEFWLHLKRPWACIIGLACQFALLPAVGFGLSLAFHLPSYEALGVLILACSPGGAFSNFFTYWVDGDLALSIMMTTLSAILAFGAMPLNLWIYATRWTNSDNLVMPFFNILVSLLFVTIPVLVGMVIRHFTRRWAKYISKVCGVLGWVGAVACGVLLVLRYWHTIVTSSLSLLFIAALLPLSGVFVAYILTKIVCFSHKICRTVAIETGCQNMVVATSIMLLSFPNSKVRGHMVIFPVLYGLCQLAEIAVAIAIFQVWVFAHRNDVTEEDVTSVIDTTLLTSVPVPAHKLSQARVDEMMRHTRSRDDQPPPPYTTSGYEESHYHAPETHMLLTSLTSDSVDQHCPLDWTPSHKGVLHKPLKLSPDSPPHYHLNQDVYSSTLMDFNFNLDRDFDLHPDQIIQSACSYDSDVPGSPTLSNKGVPNMFPVTERDFPEEQVDSPLPYGSPLPSYHSWVGVEESRRGDDWSNPDSPPPVSHTISAHQPTSPIHQPISLTHQDRSPIHQPTGPTHQARNPTHQATSPTHQHTSPTHQDTSPMHQDRRPTHQDTSPMHQDTRPTHQNTRPTHQATSPTHDPTSFNFYHQDIRLGQTRQFSTFSTKRE